MLLVSASHDEDGYFELVDACGDLVARATIYLHEGLCVKQLREQNPELIELSPRQKDCLAWVGAGKSTKEIGDLLSIADSTVNEYLKDAAQKLGATNRSQSVARALLLGLIDA